MNSEIYSWLANVSVVITLVPLIVGVLRLKSVGKYLTPMLIVVIISVITDLLNHLLVSNGINNYLVFRVFTPIELILICLFYSMFYKQYFKSIFLLIPIPLFIIVAFIDYKINGIDNFDNYATAFEAITFSILSLWSFLYIVNKMIFEKVTSEPFFWINTGILLYFAGNLILFIFNDYILTHQGSSHIALWAIHSILNIFYNILIAIGFWKTKRH